jgi:ATP-binding cassette subfamily B protein
MKLIGLLFPLVVLSCSVCGIFHSIFYSIADHAVSFYIQAASVFFGIASVVLCWYFASLTIRQRTLDHLSKFNQSMMRVDFRKITAGEIVKLLHENFTKLSMIEGCYFELLGFAIPLFVMFVTTVVLACLVSIDILLPISVSIIIITIIIKFAIYMISLCDINQHKVELDGMVESTASAVKGIQYYAAEQIVADRFEEKENYIFEKIKRLSEVMAWKMLGILCAISCLVFIIYVVEEDFIIPQLFDISSVEYIFFPTLFLYTMFVISILRYFKVLDIKLKTLNQYLLSDKIDSGDKMHIKNGDNIFLAFHGVYFQDPAAITSGSEKLLQNLSFSVLPGELITITGEGLEHGECIFELILKYYKPQSGNIYISGSSINHLSIESIRSVVGYFKQDFGLIHGTIFDNFAITGATDVSILSVAEKIGLTHMLDIPIFDQKTRKLAVSQDILFKIQVARISMRNPKILLIESPHEFESENDEQSFIEFVEHVSKKKTVIIITQCTKFIIYSDKILYLDNNNGSLFGSHAHLSQDDRYQQYISTLKSVHTS